MTIFELPAILGSLYLFAVAWPLSVIDIREKRLPNRLVVPALPITFLGYLVTAILSSEWNALISAFICAVLAFGLGLMANRFASLGMGDVKLITATTFALAWFSPISPFVALLLGFILAAAVIFVQLLRGKATLGDSLALGPYLIVGFVLTQMLSWSSYLGGFESINFL